jgi:flagellar operon protein (TIGR03826 family)
MSLRNCPQCGRLFEFVFKNLCPECSQKEQDDFEVVATHLKDNPGVGIPEISKATGVSTDKIIKMLKSGRLIVCEQSEGSLLTCERCGKPIVNGHFCPACRDSMARALMQKSGESNKTAAKSGRESSAKNESATGSFTVHFNK